MHRVSCKSEIPGLSLSYTVITIRHANMTYVLRAQLQGTKSKYPLKGLMIKKS